MIFLDIAELSIWCTRPLRVNVEKLESILSILLNDGGEGFCCYMDLQIRGLVNNLVKHFGFNKIAIILNSNPPTNSRESVEAQELLRYYHSTIDPAYNLGYNTVT